MSILSKCHATAAACMQCTCCMREAKLSSGMHMEAIRTLKPCLIKLMQSKEGRSKATNRGTHSVCFDQLIFAVKHICVATLPLCQFGLGKWQMRLHLGEPLGSEGKGLMGQSNAFKPFSHPLPNVPFCPKKTRLLSILCSACSSWVLPMGSFTLCRLPSGSTPVSLLMVTSDYIAAVLSCIKALYAGRSVSMSPVTWHCEERHPLSCNHFRGFSFSSDLAT